MSYTQQKKAVFVGINYTGTKSALRGCHNDVKNISQFLFQKYGFSHQNSKFLLDDSQNTHPTKTNIIQALQWLVQGTKAGDTLVFHYSGHGAAVNDTDGDEIDGKDEVLVPVDHDRVGMLLDDEINPILVTSLPAGVRLFAIMDCCHSATMLDNPFTYTVDGSLEIHSVQRPSRLKQTISQVAEIHSHIQNGNTFGALMSIKDSIQSFTNPQPQVPQNHAAQKKCEAEKSSSADVISISGCRDDQTSADAHISGNFTGAMSFSLIKALTENPNLNYAGLLKEMRTILKGKYTQVPQLSAGRQLDMNTRFTL